MNEEQMEQGVVVEIPTCSLKKPVCHERSTHYTLIRHYPQPAEGISVYFMCEKHTEKKGGEKREGMGNKNAAEERN